MCLPYVLCKIFPRPLISDLHTGVRFLTPRPGGRNAVMIRKLDPSLPADYERKGGWMNEV